MNARDNRAAHNLKAIATIALALYGLHFFVAIAIELGVDNPSGFLIFCAPIIAALIWWYFDLKKQLMISDRKTGPDIWIDYFKNR